jgi:hypothetical protein
MPRQREDILREIEDWLVRLECSIKADKAIQHQNSNIELEYFFRDLLNLVFNWNLGNANQLLGKNHDSFALSDGQNKLAAQVTITRSAKKIKETLTKFVGTHDDNFQRLIFIYPYLEIPSSKAKYEKEKRNFDFETNRDRFSLGTILSEAQNMKIERQEKLLELLRKELRPLGQPLQMGTDGILDALIEIIDFMSKNAPLDEVKTDELSPNQKEKLKRFQEYSQFLLGQYKNNHTCYVTVTAARDAIGYDTVRAAKVQAWLMNRSLSALVEFKNDAQKAFDKMVFDLLSAAHGSGTSAEENAVRFLLADEFLRCNVFPNPEPIMFE